MVAKISIRNSAVLILVLTVGVGLTAALTSMARASGLALQAGTTANAPSVTPVYRVAQSGNGLDGTSWTDAYTNVQDALAVAVDSSEIWVAEGIYYPDVGDGQIDNSVTATFIMTDGVALYGGFATTETMLSQRDWVNNLTVLSGDIDGNDTSTDGVVLDTEDITGTNAFHVISARDVTGTAVLDGYTITAGYAYTPDNISSSFNWGGGFYCDGSGSGNVCQPRLINIVFSGNRASRGGGMYNDGDEGSSSPSLTRVTFTRNYANYGGGMYNQGYHGISSPVLSNVIFIGNRGSQSAGGMLNGGYKGTSNPSLTNVLFSGNYAYIGGAMYNTGDSGFSVPLLRNVTFSGNRAGAGGGAMYNDGRDSGTCSIDIRNSILWDNKDLTGTGTITSSIENIGAYVTMTHSLLEGSGGSGSNWISMTCFIDNGGNIDEDPLFILPVNPNDAPTSEGNLRLQVDSPAIDAGDNNLVTDVATDLDGTARIKDGDEDTYADVDMGAYEAYARRQVVVSKMGTGSGTVTSLPAGIDCGSYCNNYFTKNSSVSLIAQADADSIFLEWGGDCSGDDSCLLSMDVDRNVTATFTKKPVLTVMRYGDGEGRVTSKPAGIDCGPECTYIFDFDTKVTLTAQAEPGSAFLEWEGNCSGKDVCQVTMDADKSVTANFVQVRNIIPLPVIFR